MNPLHHNNKFFAFYDLNDSDIALDVHNENMASDTVSFWTIGVAMVLVSPLLMTFNLYVSAALMGAAIMGVLSWRLRALNLWGLMALACVWLWVLERVLPPNIMIDVRTQLGLLTVLIIGFTLARMIKHLFNINVKW